MAQTITPNQYELHGRGVAINYSTSSLGSKPQLTLKRGRQTLNFSSDEIETTKTCIGALITVTVARIPDRGTTLFSFLLPAINLASASAKQAVRTVGVTTVVKTTVGGPPKGQQQNYKPVELKGSARQVQFIAQKAAGS